VAVYGNRTGPTATVFSGTYQIRTNTADNRCVDVSGSSTADRANVQQFGCNGSDAQRWVVSNVVQAGVNGIQNNLYEIRSVVSGKCLDVADSKTADGTNVQQFGCNGSNAQRWAITWLGNGRYQLRPQVASNRCLDVSNGLPDDSTNIQEWTCVPGTKAQQFTLAFDQAGITAIPEGTFRIKTATAFNRCIDVSGSSQDEHGKVQQFDCNGSEAQRWKFTPIQGTIYEIKAVVSNMCMDVAGSSMADHAAIQQYGCNGTNAQRWSVVSLGNGRYRLSPQSDSTKCLDVANSSPNSPADVQQFGCNNTIAQSFSIVAP
jgi:hypothetical protein